MAKEEIKRTYIGSAEIRKENITRRDNLVAAAEKEGFTVECAEAIGISWSGETTPEYWAITVYKDGKLERPDIMAARRELAAAWKGL